MVLGHEAADAGDGAVLAKTDDFATVLDAVVLEGLEGDGLADALRLLGLAEDLLFALLSAATETEDEVEGGLLLDVVVGKSAAVLELLAGEDETLLIRGDALLVLDLGLDIVDGVRRLNIERDGLACWFATRSKTVLSITRCVPDGRQPLTNASYIRAKHDQDTIVAWLRLWVMGDRGGDDTKENHRWGEGEEEEATKFT